MKFHLSLTTIIVILLLLLNQVGGLEKGSLLRGRSLFKLAKAITSQPFTSNLCSRPHTLMPISVKSGLIVSPGLNYGGISFTLLTTSISYVSLDIELFPTDAVCCRVGSLDQDFEVWRLMVPRINLTIARVKHFTLRVLLLSKVKWQVLQTRFRLENDLLGGLALSHTRIMLLLLLWGLLASNRVKTNNLI